MSRRYMFSRAAHKPRHTHPQQFKNIYYFMEQNGNKVFLNFKLKGVPKTTKFCLQYLRSRRAQNFKILVSTSISFRVLCGVRTRSLIVRFSGACFVCEVTGKQPCLTCQLSQQLLPVSQPDPGQSLVWLGPVPRQRDIDRETTDMTNQLRGTTAHQAGKE